MRNQPHQTPALSADQITSILSQVAQGMSYLASLHFVHKDLAARNVLISPNLDVKISRLSLCRDVFATDYYLHHQKLIPLRWMAPEAVLLNEFTEKSDVWSFAVLLWEVYSPGRIPMGNRTDEEVLRGQKTGENVLGCPTECPENAWKLAELCMRLSPDQRPRFSDIVNRLDHQESKI